MVFLRLTKSTMRSIYTMLIVLLCATTLDAQNTLSAVVLDSATKDPVSFATIVYDSGKKAINTNELGAFELPRPSGSESFTIQIRSIGYSSKEALLTDSTTIFYLAARDIELAEVVILKGAETPREVLFKAFDRLKENYGNDKVEYKAFYRHYCKEDSTYGRLIEAALSVYDPKGHHQIYNHPKNKIQLRVDEIRRSFDYTKNYDEHEPISIYSTLRYDLTSYSSIHIAVPEEHNYRFVDTTYYNGCLVYVIAYNYSFVKQGAKPLQFENEGRIFVNTADYAILKVEETQLSLNEEPYQKHVYKLDWAVNYTKFGDYYCLSYAKESGLNQDYLYGMDKQLLSFKDHSFHVEIMVNAVNNVSPNAFKGDEPGKDELSTMKYHKEFWQNFPVLKDSPLNKEIIADLEKQFSLKEQYETEN